MDDNAVRSIVLSHGFIRNRWSVKSICLFSDDQTRVKLSGIHHYVNANYINVSLHEIFSSIRLSFLVD